MCRVFCHFSALARHLLGFRRPSSLLTLFRWRRPRAVLLFCTCFLLPLPSPFQPLHTSLLRRGVSRVYVLGCIAYLALLAAACMCEYSMGIPFAPDAGMRGWACSLGYTSSVTFVSAVIVVLFPLVWRCVACNILVLVSAHQCPWWWCVWLPPCQYLALLAVACMRICGRRTFCSLCKQACGGGHFLSAPPPGNLCWRGYRCAFLVCIECRGAARNILVFVGRWCCGCLFVFCFFSFLCALYLPLVVCGSLRAFFVSFFHPSCPFIPCCFSAVMVALLCWW